MRLKGSKNRIQINEKSIKNECKMGIALGIDFSWILTIFGSKLEPSWHQKSQKNNRKKH